jgi:hypothetical protein
MAAYDRFEFPLPLTVKSDIGSARPIVLTLRRHEHKGKIDVALWV